MKRFGESILFRYLPSLFQQIRFFFFGHDFIGAIIRLAHVRKALTFLHNKDPKETETYTVLDAGCGTGDFSFYLAERNPSWNIFAHDIKETVLQENKEIQKKMSINNITFASSNLLTFSEKEKYNFIFSIGTLIYFSKKETKQILVTLTKAIKKGGYLYIDLPQEDFLEVQWISPKYYPHFYSALKKENSGDLYSFSEIKKMLEELDYTIIFSNKSFSYSGKLAWEIDNVIKERKLFRMRYFFLPFLKLLATADGMTKHKKGCCFVILARKGL